MNIFQEFEERKINYNSIEKYPCFSEYGLRENIDVSVIIPVHGRTQFNNIITDAFFRAAMCSNKKISVTIVEHSAGPDHESLCREWINYIWIPQDMKKFNKCLCFNMGVLYGPKADYYLFHDSDILVPENFFELLFENMKGKDAVQAFSGQRLFHCNKELTDNILNGSFHVEQLNIETSGVVPARSGAEGGSIFCTRELLLRTGLWPDWATSEYSIEDSFMFRCMQLMGNVGFCNEPPINCFHLWHEASFSRQTKKEDWDRYYAFMAMNEDGKKHLIKMMSDHFKKYIND